MVGAPCRRYDLLRALAPAMVLAALLAHIWGATEAVGSGLIPADRGPEGRALEFWDPSQSWPGQQQSDSRLDLPVHFWRAGVSLRDLFAGVEEQTGVKCGFWPGAGENPRLRINVFLNPEGRPRLRDLLAQLAWVTACTFAVTTPAEQGDRVYYLLDPSLAEGASERWRDLKIARSSADKDPSERLQQQLAATGAMLEEMRGDLHLSRSALIARYRGKNDRLLLTLLDPQRRAAAEFICGRISYDADDRRWYRLREDWSALSAYEKKLLRTAFPGAEDVEPGQLGVGSHGAHFGVIELSVSRIVARDDGSDWFPVDDPIRVVDTREGPESFLESDEILRLAVLLGEGVPEDDEAAYVEAYIGKKWEAAQQLEWERWCRTTAADRHVSDAAIDLLSRTKWPLDRNDHPMWEVQAAVARETGMHVVSDSFWQPAQRVDEQVDSAYKGLVLLCPASPLADPTQPEFALGWEWGDAGSFLRFRSLHRDVFRASILPEDTIKELDRIAAPHLPAIADIADPPTELTITLPIDLPRLVTVARSLSDLQCAYGGRIAYEDPTDFSAACRVAARGALLQPFGDRYGFFRFLLTLDEAQWRLAQSDRGLAIPEDLDESQIAALENAVLDVVGYAYARRADMSHPQCLLKTQGTLLDPLSGDDAFTVALAAALDVQGSPSLPEWSVPSRLRVRVSRPAVVGDEEL